MEDAGRMEAVEIEVKADTRGWLQANDSDITDIDNDFVIHTIRSRFGRWWAFWHGNVVVTFLFFLLHCFNMIWARWGTVRHGNVVIGPLYR